jgi:hypothetical protein
MIVVALKPAHAHVDDYPNPYLSCRVNVDRNDTLKVRTRPHGIIIAALPTMTHVYVEDQVDTWAFIVAVNKKESGWVNMSTLGIAIGSMANDRLKRLAADEC